MLKSLSVRFGALFTWLSDAGHRRALAMVVTFALTHLAAEKCSGLDIDTVDAGLGLILSAAAAFWTSNPKA
jgi:hypothetical protein